MRIYTCYSHVVANDKRFYSCYPCYPGLVAHPSNSRTSCTQKRCKRGLCIYWLLGSEKVCFHKKVLRKFHWVVHVQLWHNVITHLANQWSDILPPGKSVWFRTVKGHKLPAYFAAWTWDARSCVLRIAHCKTCGTGISSDSISSSLMLNMSVSQNYPEHSSTSFNIT
jgi:hypothetical protein